MLNYLTKGLTNKEIAEQIHLSIETVKSHLKSIYNKLHGHFSVASCH
ncbi:MAG: response regulator transcription factor [Saprospiraceae bacterium]|nr:response regulator transcription factor [Saprospiraceae bacterium]